MKRYINAAEERKVGPLTIRDNVVVECDDDYAGHLDIPHKVTSIGAHAFQDCIRLKSVTIPDSVTSIGDYAFQNCASLENVTIPDSVRDIGYIAFGQCDGLKSVTIPNSVTSIDSHAFYQCTGLMSITIPDSVTSIGDSAFEECNSLTNITIPDSVTSIGKYAFFGCESLTSVKIPDSVTSIGKGAFAWCDQLSDVDLPDGLDVHPDVFSRSPFSQTFDDTSANEEDDDYEYDEENEEDFDLSTWEGIQHSLESECEYYRDPIYEQTEAGLKIQYTCGDVESDMGIWLEPSIQGGQGGIWIYNTDDKYLAGGIDYAEFNSDVIDMVLTSSSEEDFKREYRQYLEKQIKLHSDDEE